MSVKFQQDTFQTTTQNVMGGAQRAFANGQIPGTSGKHPFAEKVGTALTGGRDNAGTKGYLAVRLPPTMRSGYAHWSGCQEAPDASRLYANSILRRPTSSSSSPTLSAPRC